jgi:hypothetical protein
LTTDALLSSHPVEVPIKDPKEIGQVFDALSYQKGACVIRQLEAALGADDFKKVGRRRWGRLWLPNVFDRLHVGSANRLWSDRLTMADMRTVGVALVLKIHTIFQQSRPPYPLPGSPPRGITVTATV